MPRINIGAGVALLAALIVIATGALLLTGNQAGEKSHDEAKRFASYEGLVEFVRNGQEKASYSFGFYGNRLTKVSSMAAPMAEAGTTGSQAASDYSGTNVQVSGVDEADIVKNDGRHIYAVSGNKVAIVDAYPAEQAKAVSEIEIQGSPVGLLVNNDRLVVFAQAYNYHAYETTAPAAKMASVIVAPPNGGGVNTAILVYDISDRTRPALIRNITVTGNYHDSRMIGDYAYAVINQQMPYGDGPVPLPAIAEGGKVREVPATEIYYFDNPDYSYGYVNILAIDTQDDSEDYNSRSFLAGSTQNMYVSEGSIYISYTKLNNLDSFDNIMEKVILPSMPPSVQSSISEIERSDADNDEKRSRIGEEINRHANSLSREESRELEQRMAERAAELEREIAKQREQTIVHRIAISDSSIEYRAEGSVPGRVLTQFSMDEHEGNFRMATTTGNSWDRTSQNHVYVLDSELDTVGSVEDLAPEESIYSARFMGNRAYLVTFKKVYPLFVIDLSEPTNPKVLGKLKIPGYSDYLHPYDESHIIGIGKDAVEAEQGDFAWYQGLKVALFDVSDPENPKEVAKYNIGDRGTDSEALRDHKAFLFSREKSLLVIPVTLAEIDRTRYNPDLQANGNVPSSAYGEFTWQGAYVFNLDAENGFQLKGRVTHIGEGGRQSYFDQTSSVRRSLYMGDVLYTISDSMIKMNGLDDMAEINGVNLQND